jgi:hypothetical protein
LKPHPADMLKNDENIEKPRVLKAPKLNVEGKEFS